MICLLSPLYDPCLPVTNRSNFGILESFKDGYDEDDEPKYQRILQTICEREQDVLEIDLDDLARAGHEELAERAQSNAPLHETFREGRRQNLGRY